MLPFILAAALSFARVPIPDSVPAETCTALAQDARGFLWIGTQSGVVRWDGQHFKTYAPPPGASYVRTLLATRDGRVWAGTFSGGLTVYDPAAETFSRFDAPLSHQRIEGLAEDRDGAVWIATQAGLDRLDPRTRRVEHVPAVGDRVRGLLVDRGGTLWVGTGDGLFVRRDGRFEHVAMRGRMVSKLFEDDRGRIWIGTTEHGAAVFDPRTRALTSIPGLSHFWIYGIAQASAREIWLATFGGGIDVIDLDTFAVKARLKHDPALPDTIGGDRIGALLRDRSGVMWVGTWGQGIARHDPATRAFRTIRHSPNLPEGLSHAAAVRAMQMQDGTILVGTNGNGVDVLDARFRRIRNLGPENAAVTCLAEGSDGTLWVATLDGDLHFLRRNAGGFGRFTRDDGLAGGPIRALTFDARGVLWAGSAEGLTRIDGDSVRAWKHGRNDPASLSGHAVEAIAFTPDGTMWVGTDNGLNVFDPATGRARRVRGLPNEWIPDLMVDRGGRLWIATHAGACVIPIFNGEKGVLRRVSNKPAEALIEDAEGQVWIGPRMRVDPKTWQVRELGAAEGVAFRSFFIASRARTAAGELLFGSAEGLLVVQPRELEEWTYEPPVVATSLHVDGGERPLPRELRVASGERGFRLDFASLDFTAPERNRYRYRLDGYDRNWIFTDASRRSLTYTNLGPGHYTLHVQGTNRAGRWSAHGLRLPVVVLPAWYETAWFRLLAAVAVAALIYALYRLRVRQLAARAQRLERLVRERTIELEAAYKRIEEASVTDPLTQLRNRRFLEQVIQSDVDLALRNGTDLVFLLVDLDHFKSVNDTYGHAAGDAVLVQTAGVLRATFRASDSVVRWGGEEFLVVARFIDRRSGAELAEKLRAAIEACDFVLPDGAHLRRTCSIGVAAFPTANLSWEQVVNLADEALYEAKRAGRNQAKDNSCAAAGAQAAG